MIRGSSYAWPAVCGALVVCICALLVILAGRPALDLEGSSLLPALSALPTQAECPNQDASSDPYIAAARVNVTRWRRDLYMTAAKMQAEWLKEEEAVRAEHKGSLAAMSQVDKMDITRIYRLVDPTISCPPGLPLELLGSPGSDGSKWACGPQQLKAPCHVLSLGSNNDYSFEEAVLKNTPCTVSTFDCTLPDSQPGHSVDPKRHRFFAKCLGSAAKAAQDPRFVTLPQAMRMIGKRRVDLFKMDIEGFEYDVLAAWGSSAENLQTAHLPVQISVEVHIAALYWGTSFFGADDTSNLHWGARDVVTPAELALLLGHLGDLGYGVVNAERNGGCKHCIELVLMRV
eukprot:m.16007 g.16007  ORF g.16007 m.16007 type:complete len:344 (-) comp3089_c0_seq1:183-1214(-)